MYNTPAQTEELPKRYFNIRCPIVASCPEGTNCTKDPMTCSRAKSALALNQSDSKEIFSFSKGLENSLKDYFSPKEDYNQQERNYTNPLKNPFSKERKTYLSLDSRNQCKYDTSSEYQTAA